MGSIIPLQTHHPSSWNGRIDFQPSVFQRAATRSIILGNPALGIETSHLGFLSVLKGENIISFDTLPKCILQKKKSQIQTQRDFSFLSPLLLLHTLFFKKFGLTNYSGGNYNPLVLVVSSPEELRVLCKYKLINCPSSSAGRRWLLTSKARVAELSGLGLHGALGGDSHLLETPEASRSSNYVGVPKAVPST